MAQLAVAGAGAAVGFVLGGPVGAQIGWALGGVAGALLFPPKGQDSQGPRLSDLTVQTSGYGLPIPMAVGRVKLAGNVIWKTDIRERATTRRQGKGGGGAKSTTYTYFLSWAVGLCEWLIPPSDPQVLRIWLDTHLVYDTTGASEVTQIPGLVWRFHPGSETQLPDPLLAATLGADEAPAHRGLAYLVFEEVPLERFGNRMPNVTVELAGDAARSFPQVATIPPAVPLWPSSPSGRTYIGNWACNVAVDYRRGRIYEGRVRQGTGGGGANEMIRVYDLVTMQTLAEHTLDRIFAPLFPFGAAPGPDSTGTGLMHLGVDGFLYVTGGGVNRVPLWKIDPDAMRAVGVFGNPLGDGFGFGDNGTRLVNPMAITSISVPRLGAKPRTFVIVQGSYSATLTIDADRMEYVWGAGDVTIEPPPVPTNLGIGPLTFPILLVPGRTRDDGGVELWYLRASELATPFRIDVVRFRYYSGAASLAPGAAMGIFRDDFASIDVQAEIDPLAVRPLLQAAFWDPDASVLQEQRAQDADLPRELTVRFLDVERGFEQNAQSWRRPVSPTATVGANASAGIDLPIPLTAGEAKAVARRLITGTWRERTRLTCAVGPRQARLVPTDPVMLTTRDGAAIRCRVLSTQLGANWVTRLEAVTEDAASYALTAPAEGGAGWAAPTMPVPYFVRLILPDLALVDDADDLGQAGLREYALVAAYDGQRFRGVVVHRSPDQASWDALGAVTTPVTWGSVSLAPVAPTSPWIWDDASVLEVQLADGELDSATDLEVLNGANRAALIDSDGRAEIIQFRDATDLGAGRYRLAGLLRGRRGTEELIASRSAGDTFVLLDATRFQFQAQASEVTATRHHRTVTVFETVGTAASTVTKTSRGRAERPYAPCQVTGTRDGSQNLTIAWIRRTRVGGEWLDGVGTVPLSESAEAYEVDVLNGPPAVARSYAADGGTAANGFDGSSSTEWIVNAGTLPKWLRVAFAAAQPVRQYGIRARASFASSDSPRSFTFEGWDGTGWVVLDSRAAETGWSNGQLRKFTLAVPATCTEFRLVVSAGSGGGNTGLAELELYRSVGGPNIAATTYAQAVLRTIAVTTPTAAYSATNQATDFGAAQPEVFVRIHQMSGLVGRGQPAEATL